MRNKWRMILGGVSLALCLSAISLSGRSYSIADQIAVDIDGHARNGRRLKLMSRVGNLYVVFGIEHFKDLDHPSETEKAEWLEYTNKQPALISSIPGDLQTSFGFGYKREKVGLFSPYYTRDSDYRFISAPLWVPSLTFAIPPGYFAIRWIRRRNRIAVSSCKRWRCR